jgi:PAS domain-containing protein
MGIDVLELQIVSALQRFTTLQRHVSDSGEPSKLLVRSIKELEGALDTLRSAQEQLVDSRLRLEQMQLELSRERDRYWTLFDEMPQPYVLTRSDTLIVEANRAASDLLNVSQRFLVGKALSVFVCEERARFLAEAARASSEPEPREIALKLRPRERAPVSVTARVSGGDSGLRWLLKASETPSQS